MTFNLVKTMLTKTYSEQLYYAVVKMVRSSRGLRGRMRRGGGNLAHFEHERTLFNIDNTIFSLTSAGLMLQQRRLKLEQGLSPSGPLTLTTASMTNVHCERRI